MAEISTADMPTVTDATVILRIPCTAASGEDTSGFGFAIASENFDKHRPCPMTSPQSRMSPIPEIDASPLDEKSITVGHSDHATFGNNHSSISKQMCKVTSGGADVQNWKSFTPSNITLNADSIASTNIAGEGYLPGVSSEDDTASPNKETVVVSENITSVASDPYVAPINMATHEDNVSTASGVSFISTTVLGVTGSATNSEEAVPDPEGTSSISSGENMASSADTFGAVYAGDTAINAPSLGSDLVDTDDTQAISCPEDHITTACDITTAPGDLTADPVFDSGEISYNTFKDVSPSLPEDATVLLQGNTTGVFTTDTSGLIPTFSATTEYITIDQSLPAISGSTNDLTCNDSNMGGPRSSFTNGNKTDTINRDANASDSAVPRDACKASTDGLNVSRNTTNTVSLDTTKCPVTTDPGNTSTITMMNATAFGNISTTYLDTPIINESSLVIHGNVTNTDDTRGTTTVIPGNTITTPGKKPTTSMIHGDTSATCNGEMSNILSCGNSMKAANLVEEAMADAEGSIILAGENPTATRKKSSRDSTAEVSFGGSTDIPFTVGTSTTTTQRYAVTNPAGHVTMNCGSITVSEDFVREKGTTTGFGGSAIPATNIGMMNSENNSSSFDYVSITSASEETFIVSPDTTVNIATTISSQNVSEQSTKSQVGQYSETMTRKTSTVFGCSTDTDRDTDTTEVTLIRPPNTVTTAAAVMSTATVLENGNTATSRRPAPTYQNINDMISEEVIASLFTEDSTECMKSRNAASIHFENALPTVATCVSLGESENTNTTSLPLRETPCLTGNDTMKKTSSGNTLSSCVLASATGDLPATVPKETLISIGKPICEFTGIRGDTLNETVSPDSTSANNIVHDRKLSVATIADDSKTPPDTTMVVPEDITSATNISLLSIDFNSSALEGAANNTSDSASINATSSGGTSEEAHYEGRITSEYSGSETILDCASTPDSSYSIRTNFQEASKGLGDTTTLLDYTTNILEGAHISHEFDSVRSKISTDLGQKPKFNDTVTLLGGYTSTEATRQTESALLANAATPSVDDQIQSETLNTPVTIGTNNLTSSNSFIADFISTSVISGIYEATPIPKESRNTISILGANSEFSAGDAAIITTTKSKATASGGSGDFIKTTTLLKDTTTFTTTSTGSTATVTALKDTVMTTQTSIRDIATVSRNKSTTILENPSTPRETVTSEKMAATTLGNIMPYSEILIPGTRTCGGIPASNINPKGTLSNDPSDYYIDRITTDSLATTYIVNILSDTISISNNVSSLHEITTSPEGILTSRNNCTTTPVQTINPEASNTVTEKAYFATEENIAIITTREAGIAHPDPKDATMTNTTEDETNSSVTINSSENITNITSPSDSPREVAAAACTPLDMTSSALRKTVPSGWTFCSRNDDNTSTSLEEVCAHPGYPSPAETFSSLACTSNSDTRHTVESVSPCLSTISVSEYISKIYETSTGLGNAVTPILFLQGTDQSIAIGDSINSVATTSTATFADPKGITISPGDVHTSVRTTLDESRESVAASATEHIPTSFGIAVTYTGSETTGTDVAKYTIATMIVSEEIITAPGDNISDLTIPRDKNTVTAVQSIHARTLTAHEEALNVDGETTSGPTTYKIDAGLIPTCTAMNSFRETFTPCATSASNDTDSSAATAVVGRSPTTATTVISGKYPTPEVTMVMEEIAVSRIISTARETCVPKITSGFTEALVSRSATESPLASSSEATIFPAETSTEGTAFSSGQTGVSRNSPSNKRIIDEEDLTVMTTSSSTSSSLNIHFSPFDMGKKALVSEDDACCAFGHSYTPENKTFAPANVTTTVPEDTTIVFGNTSKVSEGPAIITLGMDTGGPAKEIPTAVEGTLITAIAAPRDTIDATTTESSVTTLRRTIVGPGETPTINPGEKTTVTYTTTETATITGGITDETGKIFTATPRETSIAAFEKAMDSITGETFVAPGDTLIISPRETLAATFGEIAGTTCTSISQRSDTSHEGAPAIPKVTMTGVPRETAPVKLGQATETTTRVTTTIIHRKISTALPQKTVTITSSGVSPTNDPDEIPTTALAQAAHKASPLSAQSNDTPTGVAPEDTFMAAPSMTASASQGKNRTVTSLPYWSITLISLTVIIFLLAGFCMVIYYVTVFIWVAYSASLSSNTFS